MADQGINLELHTFRSPKLRSVVNDAVEFFNQTAAYPLPLGSRIIGCGVYALYYSGDFELYLPVAKANRNQAQIPIYIGKAVAPGWRTARISSSATADLSRRLHEHARSIEQVKNLAIEDFACRFMILEGIEGDLVVPVEAELIRRYQPLWNSAVDGFGNHDPGSGRYDQAKSEWDVLHPGRAWAKNLRGKSPNLDGIVAKVRRILDQGLRNSTTAS